MAKIKSAIKRVKVAEKKTLQNKMIYSEMQTAVKKYKAVIMSNKPEEAEKMLPDVVALIDGAASKGVIHKNSASRRVSIVSKMLTDLKAGKIVIAVKIDNKQRAAAKAKAKADELEKAKAAAAEKAAEKAATSKVKPEKEDKAKAKADRRAAKMKSETEEVNA